MDRTGRYRGTLDYIAAHWPAYIFGYAGIILLLLVLVIVSGAQGWWAFIPLGFAALLLVAFYLGASIWAAHLQYDGAVHDMLFDMARLRPEDRFVHIGVGLRTTAIGLGRRLTTGHMTVVDIYNPQLMPGGAIIRGRALAPRPGPDNRVSWREGGVELLPLPDSSVRVVTMDFTLGTLWQKGDQRQLLLEIGRILKPGGRLVVMERVRGYTSWLVRGPLALRLPPDEYWRELLTSAGLEVRQEEEHFQGMARLYRAEKPIPIRGQQLLLGLEGIDR